MSNHIVTNSKATKSYNAAPPGLVYSTLVELLRFRAVSQPHQRAYIFLPDGETEQAHLTYEELDLRARAIAARLQSLGAGGERVLLHFQSGLDFITAFFGCLYAGAVAVPVYPVRLNKSFARLRGIIENSRPKLALTTQQALIRSQSVETDDLNGLSWMASETVPDEWAQAWLEPESTGDTLAYLQYTSGSTGTPKGVMVTHANVLHNSALLDKDWPITSDGVSLTWLPHFHDMGLVYGIIQPLYKGIACYMMPPASFIQQPHRWLEAISRYKVTHSGGPNFAYDLCVRKVSPEKCAQLDLSRWSVAFNGAEPVRKETLKRFSELFSPFGFNPSAFCPGYGMAEATLKVTANHKSETPRFYTVDAAALERNRVRGVAEGEPGGLTLAGCGRIYEESMVRIVHPEAATECAPDEIGEIYVCGPSIAQGYWDRPKETEEIFNACLAGTGPYLRTGDLGFVNDGELYVTGRLKDLIIIRGRNHYPQDIELSVERSHRALRRGCGAAFSVEVNNEERLVVVQELERDYRQANVDELAAVVRRAVAETHELHVYAVTFVKPGSISKTSSGKIQRQACRAGFLKQSLEVIGASILEETDYQASESSSSRSALLALSLEERRAAIESHLRNRIAGLLRISPSRLDAQQPLSGLGLDSLMATELKNGLETDLGVGVSVVSLLEDLTLAGLASEVEDQITSAEFAPCSPAAGPREPSAEQALSYGQRAIWVLQQFDRSITAYNIVYAGVVRSELDGPTLRRAFEALLERHSALRSTFGEQQGVPVLTIDPLQPLDFEEVESFGWTEQDLLARIAHEGGQSFDLAHGPLLRVRLFKKGEREHVLLLVVHHMICDFWALDLLIAQLRLTYSLLVSNRGSLPPRPRLQYSDFARWQQEMLEGPEGERLSAYWQKQLAGDLPVLSIPTDRPRLALQTFRGDSISVTLNQEMVGRFREIANAERTTLFTLLLTAFKGLLYRYTGQEDILIGSPVAGRNLPGFEDVVGHFVNIVALRSDLSNDPTFRAFLRQVRRTVLDALAHQDYPFPLLTEKMNLSRDTSHSPIFQAAFGWEKLQRCENLHSDATAHDDGETFDLETLVWKQHGAPFDLTMMVLETKAALSVTLNYNTDLFDSSTILRLQQHFICLLEAIASNPDQRLSELTILTRAEQKQIAEWNKSYTDNSSIHQLFEKQVEAIPDATAVADSDLQLTYSELNCRSNQIARHLRRLGVGPEVLVAVSLAPCADMAVALMAVLKAGGAYLPLDPSYPKERLAQMLEDSQAPVVITHQQLFELIPERKDLRIIRLDTEWEEIAGHRSDNLDGATLPDNLAYVIYTSGSTGKPKGVGCTHRGLINLLEDFQHRQPLSPGLNCSLWSRFSFDVSAYEIFSPLVTGATLHPVPDAVRAISDDYFAWLERNEIHGAYIPPFMLGDLMVKLRAASYTIPLRRLLVGVEPIPEELLSGISALIPSLKIINGYGPTETTVCASLFDVQPHTFKGRNTPIGRPVQNTVIRILDKHLCCVPVGVPGEICIGGTGVSRGYLNRPEITAEKFIPDPFSEGRGNRLYKSGDLARYARDGNILFIGRHDYQVKVRGFRIELKEIEYLLEQHPGVVNAVVTLNEDWAREKKLIAYVVLAGADAAAVTQLRAYLKQKLPDYMVPSAFVLLDSLPLTTNGKIDRRALPQPDQSSICSGSAYVAPSTPVEQVLSRIWAEVLKLDEVGINNNFFDLGGHSLLATQVISRIRERLQIDLAPRVLLEKPTVADLADYLEKVAKAEEKPLHNIAKLWIEIDHLSLDQVDALLHVHTLSS